VTVLLCLTKKHVGQQTWPSVNLNYKNKSYPLPLSPRIVTFLSQEMPPPTHAGISKSKTSLTFSDLANEDQDDFSEARLGTVKTKSTFQTLTSVPEDSTTGEKVSLGSGTRFELSRLRQELEKHGSLGSGTKAELSRLREELAKKSRLGQEAAEVKKEEREAKTRRVLINKMYKDASCIDLAFLVDATGSMEPYIAAVAEQCIAIAEDVSRSCGSDRSLKFAFVAYRDYDDSPQVEFLDFTSDFEAFKNYVNSIKAAGGDDACEDVFGGLAKVGQLSWNTAQEAAKALYHIADAPCHGRRFHNNALDYHLEGDLLGRDLETLLSKLQIQVGINQYTFSHINESTRKMVEDFEKKRNSGFAVDHRRKTRHRYGQAHRASHLVGVIGSDCLNHGNHAYGETCQESPAAIQSGLHTVQTGGLELDPCSASQADQARSSGITEPSATADCGEETDANGVPAAGVGEDC
jgi:hypothetical protein